jgi:hypothetical protein
MDLSRRTGLLLVAAVVLGLCPGCLLTHHSVNVLRQDEPRRTVQFESDLARQAFGARAYDDKAREAQSKAKFVAIPFLLWYSRTDVKSENAYYNDQVAACDANADGLITLDEALAFNPAYTAPTTSAAATESDGGPPPEPDGGAARWPARTAGLQQPADAPMPEQVPR